ncbi:MAG: cation:proton antiporter [Bacteroidales bacterium]
MDIEFLKDIVIIFALATVVIFLFQRVKIPAIVGFLVTGILAGPHGLSLIHNTHEIEFFAEVGVILLLFTIGIEFSLKTLLKSLRIVIIGGSLQVGLTILITYYIGIIFDLQPREALFIGFLVALSSTAVVLKVIQEYGNMSSDYGRTAVGILIFQDLMIVPMMIFTPLLGGESFNTSDPWYLMILKGLGVVLLVIVFARYIIPWLMHEIAKTKSRELFLITIFIIVFTVAWFTSTLGLSLALGAFLAGLIISETEYNNYAFGNIIPFRDIFTSFFFVSIGMLLNPSFLSSNIFLITGVVMGIIMIKTIITGFVAFVIGLPFKSTVIAGLFLSQVGEFSFILMGVGQQHDLINEFYYQVFIAVAVVTMSVAPFIIMFAPRLAGFIMKLPLPEKMIQGLRPLKNPETEGLENHLVIIGYGLNGRNVAKAAKLAKIPYVIIDSDPDIVARERENGELIFFGDANHEPVLHQVHIDTAKSAVILIPDPLSSFSATSIIRHMNPGIHIIVRTRNFEQVEELYKLGANEVIPEEFETSVEIFSRVLTRYLIPRDEIERLIAEVRAGGYQMLRTLDLQYPMAQSFGVKIPEVEVNTVKISENSPTVGKSLNDLNIRSRFGITILAIVREGKAIPNPLPTEKLLPDDVLFMMGTHGQVSCAGMLFLEDEVPACEDAKDKE